MKKLISLLVILFFAGSLSLIACDKKEGTTLILKGDIGGYKIEMEISSSVFDSATFEGRYRYLSQKNYLSIKGYNYGNCIYIEEFYNDKNTGSFYLDRTGDTFTGHWVSDTKVFSVDLKIVSGDEGLLNYKTLADYSNAVSDKITGTYEVDFNFINDYFVTEENPVYEMGYNGGTIVFEDAGVDRLKFEFTFICGPTYHFAIADGIAVRQGDVYVYEADPYDMGENCKVVFKFGEKSVSALSDNNQSCGFGARAYVDHELVKVKD